MKSFSEIMTTAPDECLPELRELLSYHMLCEAGCPLVRQPDSGLFILERFPEPLHWSRQAEFPWVLKNAEIESHHRVLEIGPSWTSLQYAMAKRCGQLHTIELEADKMKEAAKVFAKLGLLDKVVQQQGNALNLPFADATFDRVVCVSVLEHIDGDRMKCLEEAARVVKPGGRLLLTLDVVVDGDCKTEFFIKQDEAMEMTKRLGTGVRHQSKVFINRMDVENVALIVLMVCWVKE